MGASLQLDTKYTFLQNILGEQRGKGEVYEKNKPTMHQFSKVHGGIKHVWMFLIKSFFVKTMYLPLFALYVQE